LNSFRSSSLEYLPLATLQLPEKTGKLFNFMDGKFNFSAQGSNLAPFVCNVTKLKILFEINPPLKN
jgi:hypothetical protein